MKFYCLQENLKNGLQAVSHIAGKNVNLPILNNVLIEAKDGEIKIVATDLEIGIVNKIRGKIDVEGAFTIDAKIFSDYIQLLPNKKVDIEREGNSVIVKCEKYQTKINGMEADDFPLIPQVEKMESIKLDLVEFKRALTQTVFATANNDGRIELTGVLFNFSNGKLYLAATDSFRLAEKELGVKDKIGFEKQIIIPSRAAQEILRIFTAAKDGTEENKNEIEMIISDNLAVFAADSIELSTRIIIGQFPDYKQIIPSNIKTKAFISKAELARAAKMSSLFSQKGINDINLDLPANQNKLIVSSSSGQSGENISEIESIVEGSDNAAVVNYRYFLDGLNSIDSDHVKLEIVDGNTPCVLKSDKEDKYLYIIMPIKQ